MGKIPHQAGRSQPLFQPCHRVWGRWGVECVTGQAAHRARRAVLDERALFSARRANACCNRLLPAILSEQTLPCFDFDFDFHFHFNNFTCSTFDDRSHEFYEYRCCTSTRIYGIIHTAEAQTSQWCPVVCPITISFSRLQKV